MEKNFSIGQSNELIREGRIFDLHNQYDFARLVLSTSTLQLRLVFEPSPEHGAGNPPVSIVFEDLDYLEFSPGFGTRRIRDLEEMGYKNPPDRDDEWLLDEGQSSPEDHIFFRFERSFYIRVHSHHAFLVEDLLPE